MLPASSPIALKEWAITVDALGRGEQILLVRKGGIREDGRHFAVEHDSFFLYPTHYHEGELLLKPEVRARLDEVDVEDEPDMVTLGVYAEIAEVIEITEEAEATALDEHHIWAPEYAQKRVHWKPRHPLNVLLLRCHRLQQPQAAPVMPNYGGCRSWVELVEEYPIGVAPPVLSERQFSARVSAIKDALAAAVPA